jgi:hypothetical protein
MDHTFNLTSNMLINHFLEKKFPTQFAFFFLPKMSKRKGGHLTSCVIVSFDFFLK